MACAFDLSFQYDTSFIFHYARCILNNLLQFRNYKIITNAVKISINIFICLQISFKLEKKKVIKIIISNNNDDDGDHYDKIKRLNVARI